MFKLRFSVQEIRALAHRYMLENERQADEGRDKNIVEIARKAKRQGYMTEDQFLALYKWKSPRSIGWAEVNRQEVIKEITAISFAAKTEEIKIGALTLLAGVGMPVASTILHWVFENKYPLLDYRALWSLSVDEPPATYNFEFWWQYVEACRALAKKAGVSMRVLDQALWQYSAENQNKR